MAEAQDRDRQQALFRLLRGRIRAIGISNVPLLVVVVGTAWFAYGEALDELPQFSVTLVAIVIAGLLVGNLEELPGWLNEGYNIEGAQVAGNQQSDEGAIPRRRGIALLFTMLVLMICFDFFAVGRVINASGGTLKSVYSSLPTTMLVLGAIMAKKNRTRWIVLILGIGYFALLQETSWFGDVRGPEAEEWMSEEMIFLIVTALNLGVSYYFAARTQVLQAMTLDGDDASTVARVERDEDNGE